MPPVSPDAHVWPGAIAFQELRWMSPRRPRTQSPMRSWRVLVTAGQDHVGWCPFASGVFIGVPRLPTYMAGNRFSNVSMASMVLACDSILPSVSLLIWSAIFASNMLKPVLSCNTSSSRASRSVLISVFNSACKSSWG